MGKALDRLCAALLIAAALFLFFQAAFASPLLAGGLALVCLLLLARLLRRLPVPPWRRRRQREARAAGLLERWSRMPEAEALEEVRSALAALYPDPPLDPTELILEPRPRCCPALSAGEVFSLWRACRDAERLLIVCTGSIEASAFALAEALSQPRLRLLDRAQLLPALARHPELLPDADAAACAPLRPRLPRLHRAQLPRCILAGLGLILGYMIQGRWLYLFTGLALLLIAGLSLRHRAPPAGLFS